MLVVLVLACIALIAVLIVAIRLRFALTSSTRENASTKSELRSLQASFSALRDANTELSHKNENLAKQVFAANKRNEELSSQLATTNSSLASALAANEGLVARNEGDQGASTQLHAEIGELVAQRDKMIAAIDNLKIQREALTDNIEYAHQTLTDLLAWQVKVEEFAEDEDNDNLLSFSPVLDRATTTTLKLVNELLESVSDKGLRGALLKWVWECAYRPVFQSGLKSIGIFESGGGIYGLELVDQPGIWYIGQAVSFKERWYQHARKMIGLDSCGNERLYCYEPDAFRWCIVEQLDHPTPDQLNEREAYYIKWFGADSKGLNRKG